MYVDPGAGPISRSLQLHLARNVSRPQAELGGASGRPGSRRGGPHLRVGDDRQPVAAAEPLLAVRRAEADLRGPARGAGPRDGEVVHAHHQ